MNPTTILVTGGTGALGAAFVRVATHAGHRVRILSRREAPARLPPRREWVRGDVRTGAGIEKALAGMEVILHAAADPRGDAHGVEVDGTRRLAAAAKRAGVSHLLYPSIVGIERIPAPYYRVKVEAERVVADSGVPYTIARITQFHSFVGFLLSRIARLPIMPIPGGVRLQSIDAGDAAAHLLEGIAAGPEGRIPDVAGPEVLRLPDMARSWCRVLGRRRLVLPVRVPGAVMGALREGHATAPDRRVGEETWAEWLVRQRRSSGSA